MSKLLFRMRDVPDDEADEVRALLDQHQIDYFETFPGNWGISMPGLWVSDDLQFKKARALLDEYQDKRSRIMQADYQQRKMAGDVPTLPQLLLQQPLKVVMILALVAVVLYLSLSFFLTL